MSPRWGLCESGCEDDWSAGCACDHGLARCYCGHVHAEYVVVCGHGYYDSTIGVQRKEDDSCASSTTVALWGECVASCEKEWTSRAACEHYLRRCDCGHVTENVAVCDHGFYDSRREFEEEEEEKDEDEVLSSLLSDAA